MMQLRSGILFCLVGPAGSGKTSVSAALLGKCAGSLNRSISYTSRAMRDGEVAGKSYHFVSRLEFEAKLARGEFFEAEEVHGNLYGTLRATIDQAVNSAQDLILEIDIKGAINLRAHYPQHVVTLFIAPSSPKILRERIVSRGAVSEAEVALRMSTARSEYAKLRELISKGQGFDYLIINDNFDVSVDQVYSIVTAERVRIARLREKSLLALVDTDF